MCQTTPCNHNIEDGPSYIEIFPELKTPQQCKSKGDFCCGYAPGASEGVNLCDPEVPENPGEGGVSCQTTACDYNGDGPSYIEYFEELKTAEDCLTKGQFCCAWVGNSQVGVDLCEPVHPNEQVACQTTLCGYTGDGPSYIEIFPDLKKPEDCASLDVKFCCGIKGNTMVDLCEEEQEVVGQVSCQTTPCNHKIEDGPSYIEIFPELKKPEDCANLKEKFCCGHQGDRMVDLCKKEPAKPPATITGDPHFTMFGSSHRKYDVSLHEPDNMCICILKEDPCTKYASQFFLYERCTSVSVSPGFNRFGKFSIFKL